MGEQPRGYTFIATSKPEEEWRKMAVCGILKVIGVKHVKIANAYTEPTNHLSLEQMCEKVALSKEGGEIVFDLAGFTTTFWLPPFRHLRRYSLFPQENFQYFTLEVPKYDFGEPPGDPMRIELFAEKWTHLCETQEATAAFFTMGSLDEDVYVPEFVDALQTYALEKLAPGRNWRTYLASTIASCWEQKLKGSKIDHKELLPSGGLVLSSKLLRGYNPVSGDTDLLPNAQFLIEQIAAQSKIVGAKGLLAVLRLQTEKLQEIEDQQSKTWSRENFLAENQIRMLLHHIRATWAYALQSTDLVGVVQLVKSEGDRGGGISETVEVPVIADGGRTWVYPTLRYPFELADEAWTDRSEGLEVRAFNLLEAAQHNPVAGEPPRVVVYFWRGVSQGVREALGEMGARVEVADRLPVLG